MDKIVINNLESFAFHGVLEEENRLGQKFFVTAELYLDLEKAGTNDDLSYSVNYAEICHLIDKEMKEKTFELIEAAAEHLASVLLEKYDSLLRVVLTIKKPWAPIGKHLDHVSATIDRAWHKAFIGLGSNLGDRNENLKNAIDRINETNGCHVEAISSIYETKPFGPVEQPDFLNCAIEIKTLYSPNMLMELLLSIEAALGRVRTVKWGPRTIDLDLLLYDNLVTMDGNAIIPHPLMHEREFVLRPLCDIAPYAIHPLLNKRVVELLSLVENK